MGDGWSSSENKRKGTFEKVKILNIVIMGVEVPIFVLDMDHSFLLVIEDHSAIVGVEGVFNQALVGISSGVIGVGQAFLIFLEEEALIVLYLEEVLHLKQVK